MRLLPVQSRTRKAQHKACVEPKLWSLLSNEGSNQYCSAGVVAPANGGVADRN